jgi:uncharacterized protein (DUF1800 family)
MLRHFCISAGLIAILAAPSLAVQPTFAISNIPASTTRGDGRDAGIDVSTSRFVRLTASGTLTTRIGACGRYYTPAGCGGNQGALMAAFATAGDRPISGWFVAGKFANLAVPFGAQRLLLRVNGVTGREVGSYHVVADAVPTSVLSTPGSGVASSASTFASTSSAAATRSITTDAAAPHTSTVQLATVAMRSSSSSSTASRATTMALSRSPGSGPTVPVGTTSMRSDVQYVMRRLGFSDTPEQVTYWYTHGGVAAWLAYQLNYTAISDSTIGTYVRPMPTLTGNTSIFPDNSFSQIAENRLLQQQVATQRQLLEKVTLHWLEHFAISENTVNDPGAMDHYVETVRADALGNFAKLVSDVSKEPAMLYWLDNNYNNGNSPTNPPNQNFGRELMQLYTIGLNELNLDGTPVLDGTGNPIPTYAQADVVTASDAVTGFQVHGASTLTGAWPSYLDTVTFSPAYHYNPVDNGGKPLPTIFGQTISDPGGSQCAWNGTNPPGAAASGPCVIDNLVSILASQPTTCAFEAKEMIERLANENPSPGYVSRVANVWCANLTAPNQIALVVNAIGSDPEFLAGKYEMVKEPLELEIDAIRALRGSDNPVDANPVVGNNIPLNGPMNDLGNMQERTWYPPTVFSFYYPGQKESLMNNVELLARWQAAADLGSDAYVKAPSTQQDTSLDLSELAPAGSTATMAEVNRGVNYLLDALVDGGTPELKALVTNYMMNYRSGSPTAGNSFQNGLKGAIWMVMTSPEDEEN